MLNAVRAWRPEQEVELDEPLTAEEEIIDWMNHTPMPARSRPGWLPEGAHWTPVPGERQARPPRATANLVPLVVGAVVAVICSGLALMVVALGSIALVML